MAHKSAEARSKSDPKEGAKPKLVRDSFTMPKADYALIEALKIRALDAKRPAKKSELLRAGLQALAALSPEVLVKSLDALTPLKAGRPKKSELPPAKTAAKTPAKEPVKAMVKAPEPVRAVPPAKPQVKTAKAATQTAPRKASVGAKARQAPSARPTGKTLTRPGRSGAASR